MQVAGAGSAPQQAVDAAKHLLGGAPREGEEKDAARRHAFGDEVGDAVGEGGGLAGARAGYDQQRAAAVGRRCALRVVQAAEHRGAGLDLRSIVGAWEESSHRDLRRTGVLSRC